MIAHFNTTTERPADLQPRPEDPHNRAVRPPAATEALSGGHRPQWVPEHDFGYPEGIRADLFEQMKDGRFRALVSFDWHQAGTRYMRAGVTAEIREQAHAVLRSLR